MKGVMQELERMKKQAQQVEKRPIEPRKGRLVFDGEEHLTIAQAAAKHGMSRSMLNHRHLVLGLNGAALFSKERLQHKKCTHESTQEVIHA